MEPFMAYYAIGVFSYLLLCILCFHQLTLTDVLYSVFCGLLGPLILFVLLLISLLMFIESLNTVVIFKDDDKKDDD